jgi:ABC-2 type transport system permease protein
MKKIYILAKKELVVSFVTPIAYVVLSGFMIVSGYFFFSLLAHYNSYLLISVARPDAAINLNEWVVLRFYNTLEVILVFLIPTLTMRSFAEEKSQGTFELLATSPLTVAEIVWGKFIGVSLVVFIMLASAFIFPLVLILLTDPEVFPIIVGLFGLLLFALAFVTVGLICSACTTSQTVAGISCLIVSLLIYAIDAPANKVGKNLGELLSYLSPSMQVEMILKGVVESGSIVYFLSFIILGLFLTNRVLEAQNIR